MNFQRKCLIVFLSLLLHCELMEATGFGKFARKFPSQTNGDTCGDVAKVRNHMESTKRYETSETATMHTTAHLPLTEQELTSDPKTTKQLTSKPPTSRAKQELTKQLTSISPTSPTKQELAFDQQNTKQLTSTPTTSPTKQELTKQLTSISPTSPTKQGLAFDQQTTKQLTSTPTTSPTKQEFTKQLTSISPTSPTKRELTSDQHTTKQLISTSPTSPPCAPNMVLGPSCECERTCQDPTSCNCTGPVTCVCPGGFLMNSTECVPAQECGCYVDNGTRVIPDGAPYVQERCSRRCTCNDNVLSCDSAYTCSPHATCRVEDGVRQCYCNDGYVGDGETCKLYTDCYDAYQAGHKKNGNFTILPYGWSGSPFNVTCDMTTNGGGWTVIQRRFHEGVFGQRSWQEYKNGFGSNSDSHWLGNEKISYLTNQRNYVLRVDLVSFGGAATYQQYSLFKIGGESDNYRMIDLGSSSGIAGNGMDGSLGRQFSTTDVDNDGCNGIECSQKHGHGGWWYSNTLCTKCCNSHKLTCFPRPNSCKKRCTKANLNGWYSLKVKDDEQRKIFWNGVYGFSSTEMKIRPVDGSVH